MLDTPDLREQAIDRIKKKQDFRAHLLVYLMVNALVWTIWALTGANFPWPVFVTFGWGIGLVMIAWEVFWRTPITDEAIEREIERMHHA